MEMKWLLNYFSNFPRADPKEASFVIVESGCYLDRPPSIFELSSDVQPTAPPSPPKCQQKGSLAPSKQLVSHQGSSTHPYPHTTPSFSAPPHLFPGLSSRYFRPHTTQPSHPPRGSHRRTKWQTLRQRSILTRSSTVSWKAMMTSPRNFQRQTIGPKRSRTLFAAIERWSVSIGSGWAGISRNESTNT